MKVDDGVDLEFEREKQQIIDEDVSHYSFSKIESSEQNANSNEALSEKYKIIII